MLECESDETVVVAADTDEVRGVIWQRAVPSRERAVSKRNVASSPAIGEDLPRKVFGVDWQQPAGCGVRDRVCDVACGLEPRVPEESVGEPAESRVDPDVSCEEDKAGCEGNQSQWIGVERALSRSVAESIRKPAERHECQNPAEDEQAHRHALVVRYSAGKCQRNRRHDEE